MPKRRRVQASNGTMGLFLGLRNNDYSYMCWTEVVSVGSQTILSLGSWRIPYGLLSVEFRNQVVTGLGHLRT